MCVVSMVMDSRSNDWLYRYYQKAIPTFIPQEFPPPVTTVPLPTALEIEEFRRLLERARDYDKKNGEPDCELEEKRELLRRLAKALGVSVEFLEVTPKVK